MKLIILIVCVVIMFSCNNKPTVNGGLQCSNIDTAKFISTMNKNWPYRKPKSVVDAIRLLDSLSDENFNCVILKFHDEDLYFNLGLRIRNNWVRNGTDSLKSQLFSKIGLRHIDYSSGLIIDIYRKTLLNDVDDLAVTYKSESGDSISTKKELLNIQKELTESMETLKKKK
jgi:hypothetical protein